MAASVKRKADGAVPSEESDLLRITPLGSGQEVGRSCHFLEFKGKKVLLDVGIHPGMTGVESLPFLDEIDTAEIDLLLISHFHLDHCGALPWLLEKTTFKGRVFMTHATKAIYRWLLSDYVKVSNIAVEDMLYSESDLEKSMDKIETIHFHQEKEVGGIKFWCYHAGHVLGAAMFMIEIAGVKILYTGDFSRQEDRHLMAAEIPTISPDVLIVESTYGTHIHEKREERESRFTGTVNDIVNRGGRCLIPVFALGRAQELLLILDEYWQNHPELHDIPIYYASQLAKKCMSVFQTYVNAMNDKIKKQIAISNPFVFKHISNLKSIDQFDDIGPSVVMASPGMMQSGLSRELFEQWCTDRRNGVIIAGYCVEGTLAKHSTASKPLELQHYCVEGTLAKNLMAEPEEIATMSGQKIQRKCSIDYISFSAHTDFEQTSEFIRTLKPPNIILVHGEKNEMGRLKAALIREYEDNPELSIAVHNPPNCQSVELYFRGEKMAKVMGQMARDKAQHGKHLSGILIKRGFNYHLIAPDDLQNYTELATSVLTQKQSVAFHGVFSVLKQCLENLAGRVDDITIHGKEAIKVFGAITVIQEKESVLIEWTANSVNDMYADAVLAVILQVESNPMAAQAASQMKKIDVNTFHEKLITLLSGTYGEEQVVLSALGDEITVHFDEHKAIINLDTLDVDCSDESLSHHVTHVVKRLNAAFTPCYA